MQHVYQFNDGLWCLTSLSTIFQLYRGSQFFLVEETGMLGENNRKSLIKLYHIMLYLLSRIRTHNVSHDRYWLHR